MVRTDAERAGVIGGGLGGLAAACTLAARGHRVILFEKNAWLGGKAAVLEHQGYRFDMGPTILTLPSVLRRIFAEAGQPLDDYLQLVRLDPQWRCFYTDGTVLDLHENVEQMAASLNRCLGNEQRHRTSPPGECYRQFIRFAERMHQISDRYYFWRPIGSIWDMFDYKFNGSPTVLWDVLRMRMGYSVAQTVRHYTPDPRVAQMLDHFTQYVGSNPEASPAVLCGIASMQIHEGVWYPLGGVRAVAEALIRLAQRLNVEVRLQTGVRRILVDNKQQQVRGVETETGEVIPLRAVVSNADSVRTHRELLAETAPEVTRRFERRRRYEPACSGVVLFLALRRGYDHLLHHNFVFSQDPHEEFQAIYQRGEPASDPTCYLAAPARTDPTVAPAGGEALYVLVHTPYLRPHHDWRQMLPHYRRVILRKLQTTGQMPDIEERIVWESHLTPQDIHERYRVLNGAIYGLASHGRWGGAFKPSNRSPDVRGLYFAGGAAHPGPGMPMVLMSGWIAADTLNRDLSPTVTPQPPAIAVTAPDRLTGATRT
ncbi:MAG: phytoene desaturase family protein [Gemmataceae bacterium]|nr:phytoene desaturase family protein [Gemmataceae bacterium]MDW8244373.1 phytoene desaturase family protein [Thermogemmata sp.]